MHHLPVTAEGSASVCSLCRSQERYHAVGRSEESRGKVRLLLRLLWGLYSGLKNPCNVWELWADCDTALDSMQISLSASVMK